MPRKTGAIIPSDTDPPDTYRRVLCIPGTPDWIALVTGALWVLTQSWYWDAASGDVEAVTTRAQQMYFEFQDENGGCDVPIASVGDIKMSVSATPATGWLLCDGSQYNRVDYPELAALIPEGTPNIGGDSDVFLVPNMTGRVPMGAGDTAWSPATGAAMGTIGGSNVVGLGINDIPAHTHGYATGAASGATGSAPVYSNGVFLAPQIQTASAGNGSAPTHSNLQPYFAVYYHIYAGG